MSVFVIYQYMHKKSHIKLKIRHIEETLRLYPDQAGSLNPILADLRNKIIKNENHGGQPCLI